jgi:hypothetical protein
MARNSRLRRTEPASMSENGRSEPVTGKQGRGRAIR